MKKKRIFFIMPNLGGGGGERIISILINNLDRSLYDPSIVIIKKRGSNVFLKDLKKDVQIINLNVRIRIMMSFPTMAYRLISLCRKKRPDVLFFGSGQINALFSVFLPLFPKEIKFIARESNIPSQFEKYYLIKLLYKLFYSNYDKVIVQSDDMYNDLHMNFNLQKSKLVKINNPVDIAFILNKLKEDKITLHKNVFNILAAGRLTYQKGFDMLINELSKIKDVNYHLTILGDGEDEILLRELTKKLGLEKRISFVGSVNNPYKYMASADIFVLSSRFEGFPNVVLESLTCGTPVLANNCLGGIKEIVKPGFNGEIFSFEERNFHEFFIKIINADFNKKEISKDAISRFSVSTKIKEFQEVIQE